GGLIIVPFLTLFLHIDIRYAIASSLLAIIATSSGAAAKYLKDSLTNLRVGVFLEVGTVFGAISGFFLVSYINPSLLYFLFAGFLIFSALMMLKQREEQISNDDHPFSKKMKFASQYTSKGETVHYKVEKVW